jgi:hypothetical protein
MGKRNLENVVIKSNRYGNDVFRKGYDRIKWEARNLDRNLGEVVEDGIEEQIRGELKKGRVCDHFV